MGSPSADQRAPLGALLANGLVRIAGQSPLSKVQWLLLALFVACAVILGLALQPRQQDAARDPSPVQSWPVQSSPGPADAPAAVDATATTIALDKLAAEVAAINRKLDEVVLDGKRTALRVSSLEGAGKASRAAQAGRQADAAGLDSAALNEAAQNDADRPVSRRERGALTVHRPSRATSAARRPAAANSASAKPASAKSASAKSAAIGPRTPPGVLVRRIPIRRGGLRERRRRSGDGGPIPVPRP